MKSIGFFKPQFGQKQSAANMSQWTMVGALNGHNIMLDILCMLSCFNVLGVKLVPYAVLLFMVRYYRQN